MEAHSLHTETKSGLKLKDKLTYILTDNRKYTHVNC